MQRSLLLFILVALSVGALVTCSIRDPRMLEKIPVIENPPFMAAQDATFMKDDELVLGVIVDGQAKAYPIRILNQYEILNDHVGNRSVFATW